MNRNGQMSFQEGVAEVLNQLTGLDLEYLPVYERFQSIGRFLNRALRQVATENEWSYFSDVQELGTAVAGEQELSIPSNVRPRITNDDSVRLNDSTGRTVRWAYFLPRDAIHKYAGRRGLWVASTRNTLTFSRPFFTAEDGLRIFVPVMRMPRELELPDNGDIPDRILDQSIDFDFPDLITARAAFLYAQTDPVMQPRVPTLEAVYKDMMYQLIERDTQYTDSPFLNDFTVPIEGSLEGSTFPMFRHPHPHSDERW